MGWGDKLDELSRYLKWWLGGEEEEERENPSSREDASLEPSSSKRSFVGWIMVSCSKIEF